MSTGKNKEYIETLYTNILPACSGNMQATLALRELKDMAISNAAAIEGLLVGITQLVVQTYLGLPDRRVDLFVVNGGKK